MNYIREHFSINKLSLFCAIFFGSIYGVIFSFGRPLELFRYVNFRSTNAKVSLLLWCMLCIAISLFLFCFKWKTVVLENRIENRNVYWLFFLLFGLIWIIFLIGNYPGIFSYDAPDQLEMYLNKSITEHHPILHTLFLGYLMELGREIWGSYEAGCFLYSLLQIIITDLCISYLMYFLYKKGVSKCFLIVASIWFCAMPSIILATQSTVKDSLFAPFYVVLLILSYEMLEEPDDFFSSLTKKLIWVITTVLCIINRNNAIYPLSIFLVALFFINRKRIKEYAYLVVGVILLFGIYTGPFCNSVAISRLNPKEFYSVPVQQLMWVYKNENDNISEEEKVLIEEMFGQQSIDWYDSRIADIPKYNMDYDLYLKEKETYQKLWIKWGMEYPFDYINSFLENNYGFWYPFATYTVNFSGEAGYMSSESRAIVVTTGKIPTFHDALKRISCSDRIIRKWPTKWFFSMGTYFCIFMCVFAFAIIRKMRIAYFFGVTLLYWMTFLLGPGAVIRYSLYLIYSMPFFIWFLLYCNKKNSVN